MIDPMKMDFNASIGLFFFSSRLVLYYDSFMHDVYLVFSSCFELMSVCACVLAFLLGKLKRKYSLLIRLEERYYSRTCIFNFKRMSRLSLERFLIR